MQSSGQEKGEEETENWSQIRGGEKKSKDDAKVSSFMNVSNGVGICFYVTLYLFFTLAQSFHCMGKHYY